MNSMVVKLKSGKDLYEVEYLVHPSTSAPTGTTDVYACHRLSAYDGMPIGPKVFISAGDLEEADRERLASLDRSRLRRLE